MSFKYLKCSSSLGTLLTYCSSKDDFHQFFPKKQCPFTGVTLLIAQCLLEDVGVPWCPQILKYPLDPWLHIVHQKLGVYLYYPKLKKYPMTRAIGTLVSVHGTSEDGSIPLNRPNFTTLLDLEEMKERF